MTRSFVRLTIQLWDTNTLTEASGTETNQDETARPPILRYNIRTEYLESPSENRRLDNAATKRPSLAKAN